MSNEHDNESPAVAPPLPSYRVTGREADTVYLHIPGWDDVTGERTGSEHGIDLATARRLRDELSAALGDAPGNVRSAAMQPPETAPLSSNDGSDLHFVLVKPVNNGRLAVGLRRRNGWRIDGRTTLMAHEWIEGWWPLPAMPASGGGEAKEGD